MPIIKFACVLFIGSCLIIGGAPSSSKSQSSAVTPAPTQDEPNGELKVLAAGLHSAIQNTFVAVIRDAESYAQLKKLSPELPKLDAEFFQSRAVVAAFLGERNTGGYDVEITADGTGVRVTEKTPGKGMMVPQMITAPYKIVSVSAPGTSSVVVAYPASANSMQSYSVRSGEFTNGGGFVGEFEHYGLEGKVEVLRQGNLVTLNFVLKNAGETNQHLLFETVTGVTDKRGAFTISKMSAGALVSIPNGGLKAMGQFSNENTRLSLEFSSGASHFTDGYGGGGVIEAIVIRPPQKP